MRTILLPTEFSVEDRTAVDYATRLIGDEPARFVLVHAQKVPDGGTALKLSGLNSSSYRRALRHNRRELSYLCRTYANSDRTFTVDEAPGSLSFLLSRCVRDYGADLVVMRKRPGSWLEQYLPVLGNGQMRLATRLRVPVLFVPEGAPFSPPREIAFFASPTEDAGTEDLQPLYDLAARYGAGVTGYTLTGDRPVRYELNGSTPSAKLEMESVDWSEVFDRSVPDLLVTRLTRNNPLDWLGQQQMGTRLARQHALPLMVI